MKLISINFTFTYTLVLHFDIPNVKECLTNARTLQNEPDIEVQATDIEQLLSKTLAEVAENENVYYPNITSTILLPEINGEATVPNQLGNQYLNLDSISEDVYNNANSLIKGKNYDKFMNSSFNNENDLDNTFVYEQGLDTALNFTSTDQDIISDTLEDTEDDEFAELNLSDMDFLENFDDLSQWSISEVYN